MSPHCDAGSVERWIDEGYQKFYNDIFMDNFEKYNPFNALNRDQTKEIESPAVSHVFRTFQGWELVFDKSQRCSAQLIPIAKSISFIINQSTIDWMFLKNELFL